jgi:hypothetical protein
MYIDILLYRPCCGCVNAIVIKNAIDRVAGILWKCYRCKIMPLSQMINFD